MKKKDLRVTSQMDTNTLIQLNINEHFTTDVTEKIYIAYVMS